MPRVKSTYILVAGKGNHFRFGLVFIKKKVTKLKKKILKNQNRFKPTGFGSVWFFRTKTGSNRFGSVFSSLARFFWVWVRFGFFGFLLIKPNRPVFLKF